MIETGLQQEINYVMTQARNNRLEFVVEVIKRFFSKSEEAAQAIMLKVHIEGEGVCGTYSHDVAQTKVSQVVDFARKHEQPLMCVIRELN